MCYPCTYEGSITASPHSLPLLAHSTSKINAGSSTSPPATPKPCYAVLFPGKHTRERLADLFLPDAPPDCAGRYLSNLIYRLRQSLGETWLEIQDEYIALNTGQDLRVDVVEFESLLAGGDQEAIHRALALYHGDLPPEIYTDWILPRRVALREKYLVALNRLPQAAEDDHNIDKAFGYYHRLTTEDPLVKPPAAGRCVSTPSIVTP